MLPALQVHTARIPFRIYNWRGVVPRLPVEKRSSVAPPLLKTLAVVWLGNLRWQFHRSLPNPTPFQYPGGSHCGPTFPMSRSRFDMDASADPPAAPLVRLVWVQDTDGTDFQPHFVETDDTSLISFSRSVLASHEHGLQLGRDGSSSVQLRQSDNSADSVAGKRAAAGNNASHSTAELNFATALRTEDFITLVSAAGGPSLETDSLPASANSAQAILTLAEQCEKCVDSVLSGLSFDDDQGMLVAFSALATSELTRRVKELGALISKRAECLAALGAKRTAQLTAAVNEVRADTRFSAVAARYSRATQRWQAVLGCMQAAMAAASADPQLRAPLRVGDALPQVHTHVATPMRPVIATHRGAVLVLLRHFG